MEAPRRAREQSFYDTQASAMRAEELPPRAPDDYELALLDAAEPLAGMEVLELGCGAGDLTLALLERGARVTAVDLSARMVKLAGDRARRYVPDGKAVFVAAPVERTGLPGASFDRVVGKWILHHAEPGPAAAEAARLLKPGGAAAFYENQDRNPLLRLARRRALGLPGVSRVGTLDERPLTRDDIAAVRAAFGSLELRYPSFYCFEALSRALGHRGHRRLRALDSALWRRVPAVRPWSYHVLIVGR